MNSKIKYFLPAVFWFLLSFYLLTLPGSAVPKISWFDKIQADKLVHVGMFAILVVLVLLPMQFRSRSPLLLKTVFAVALVALAYGIAMEFVQEYFVPNRSFDVFDMVADGVGCFSGVLCWKYLLKKRSTVS
jgi:VanZ family protein